jgi:GDPmannose 4,6-dehydratase
MPRALVTGVSGQDGWYLSDLLAQDGFAVYGLVTHDDTGNLHPAVTALVGDMRDSASLRAALAEAAPDEVYNLASLSSVSDSWQHAELVADINGVGLLRLLVCVQHQIDAAGRDIRVVQAGSAEIFGDAPAPQDESTPLAPVNPYGAAKAFAQHAVRAYRASGLWVGSAILFNHESPRRPPHFVTRKIAKAAAAIAKGSTEPVRLGNLAARRDWGYAGDYMQGLIRIARHDVPDDFVLATGVGRSVEDFVRLAFDRVAIDDWRAHVEVDPHLSRIGDPSERRGDAAKARRTLGWVAETDLPALVAMMVDAELAAD